MAYELLEEESPQQNIALSLGQEGLRHGARTASNIATRAVGLPGDVFSLLNQFIAKPVSKKITGQEGLPYEETLLGKAIPTTESHRKGLESISGEYLKPKNKIEKFADDIAEDTALLLNPAGLVTKGLKGGKVVKSFFKSLGANLAGETATQVSGSETAGGLTKLGSLLFLSLMDQPAAAKQVGKLYGEAESKLPSNATSNAVSLNKKIDSLEKQITKGRPLENLSPPEKFVIDQSGKIKNLIQNGEINVEQAIAQKKSLYKELGTLYKEVPKHTEQKTVKNLAKKLGSYINQTVEEYGKKNPKFYKDYKKADEAFGTLAQSNFLTNWIGNNIVQHPLTTGLLHIFGAPIGAIAGTATGAIVPYQAAKLGYRISKSPTLAKIYANTVKAAVKEDAKAFNKYLKDLDNELQEEESEDKFEFVD